MNREFRLSLELRTGFEVGSLSVNLNYDPEIVTLKEVTEGGLIRQEGNPAPFLKNIDNTSGACTIGISSPNVGRGFKGGGTLAILVFESVAEGEAVISVSNVTANRPSGQPIDFETSESRVIVR